MLVFVLHMCCDGVALVVKHTVAALAVCACLHVESLMCTGEVYNALQVPLIQHFVYAETVGFNEITHLHFYQTLCTPPCTTTTRNKQHSHVL